MENLEPIKPNELNESDFPNYNSHYSADDNGSYLSENPFAQEPQRAPFQLNLEDIRLNKYDPQSG
ncbi:hypothetical protein PJM29_30530, partial [Mycobacterium kansasii]